MQATDLPIVASHQKSVSHLPSKPLTIEQFLAVDIPMELSGEYGTNRAKGIPCQIEATNDLAAIWAWLEEFKDSPKTLRSYRKEVERFYNWAMLVAQKPLSSFTIADISRYEAFVADPQPEAFWIGDKKEQKRARRGETNWRPFEKPLSPKSIAYASIVIGAMFNYLKDVNYLYGNPLSARRLKAKKNRAIEQVRKPMATQYLSLPTLMMLLEAIESEIDSLPADDFSGRSKYERMLFTTRFLANTGLRREEMAGAVMSDIYSLVVESVRSWFIRIVGKGGVERHVPLNEKSRESLSRYLAFYGHPEQHINNSAPMLLPLSGKAVEGRNLSDQTVYAIIKEALAFGAEKMNSFAADEASLLRQASPHKFRHTFTTIMTETKQVSLKMVSEILGHQSIETTAIYTHANMKEAFLAVNKAGV